MPQKDDTFIGTCLNLVFSFKKKKKNDSNITIVMELNINNIINQ